MLTIDAKCIDHKGNVCAVFIKSKERFFFSHWMQCCGILDQVLVCPVCACPWPKHLKLPRHLQAQWWPGQGTYRGPVFICIQRVDCIISILLCICNFSLNVVQLCQYRTESKLCRYFKQTHACVHKGPKCEWSGSQRALINHLTYLPPSAAYMRRWTGSASIGSGSRLSPVRRQAITWTKADVLSIGPLGTNFSEILVEIVAFSLTKMRLKMSFEMAAISLMGIWVNTHLKCSTRITTIFLMGPHLHDRSSPLYVYTFPSPTWL